MKKIVFNKCLVPLIWFLILSCVSDVGGTECKCPVITNRRGVALTCRNSQGITVNCSSPAPPSTTIDFRCSPFYRPVRRGSSIAHQQLRCNQDCTWQNMRRLEEFICEIDCGKPSQPHVPFIAKGQKTLRYSWPWHATIFVKDKKTFQNHYICGGTLISEHVVLTAAHCLITARQYPLESYHVVLGAISSNWTENIADAHAQFFRINGSYTPDEYDRVEHRSDIALVELDKSIVISEAVSPACFPYDNDLAKPQEPVVAGEGEVVGYGKNEHGEYEHYLKYTRLPVLGADKCYEILEKRQGIEQFCAGVVNGSSVCNGDSGGGMVFKGQGVSRYYLQGIVSHGLLTRDKVICDGLSYFTNVLYFTRWVAEIVDRIEEKNELVSEQTTSNPNRVVPVDESTDSPSVPANDFVRKNGECTEILMEDGIDITCSHQGKPINCSNASNGKIATYACKYGYQSGLISTTRSMCRDDIWTKRNSRWHCILQCGLGANHFTHSNQSLIVNLPWNVELYKKSGETSGFEYFCAGTLVSPKAVITAAHCVTKSGSTVTRDLDEIILYFGKLNRNIGSDEVDVQMRKVKEIHVHEEYTNGYYGSDIALIITDDTVTMTESIGPVCLPSSTTDINKGDMNPDGYSGGLGTLNGFEMDSIALVSNDACSNSHPVLKTLLNPTSFCAGYKNGTSACGYGGAGLYFENMSKKWELHGILSAGVAKSTGGCDPRFYTVFVQVLKYMEWIEGILDMS